MENILKDAEDWKKIAVNKQLELNAVLGRRRCDKISKHDLLLLKKKIGYATCGNPKDLPASDNFYTGYSDDDIAMIKIISDQIISISEFDPILFGCIFLITHWENEMSCIPVFRIENRSGSVFFDTIGRVYESWEHFKTNNELPKCIYCCPLNGEYISKPQLTVEFIESPSCKFLNQATNYFDTVATAATIGATVATFFVASPILVPVIGVTSVFHAGRSVSTLCDRNKHKQSINIDNREARNAWLNIAGSAVGLGTAAAVSKAEKIVNGGKQLSKLSVFGIRALNVGSLVFNGFGFVDNFLLCAEKCKKGALTPLDVFHLSCELLFFFSAISSVQATSKMLNQMSQVKVSGASSEKVKLTKSQKRNFRRKLSRQKAKLVKLNGESSQGESSRGSTSEMVLSAIVVGLLNRIVKRFIPSVEELQYHYYSVGHNIKCLLNNEISTDELFISLIDELPKFYNQIKDDVTDMLENIKKLYLKIKEYICSASSDQQTQFCISIQNLDNRIESIIKNINEEIEALGDSDSENTSEEVTASDHSASEKESVESVEDYLTDGDNNEEGIAFETQELITKIEESIIYYFKCKTLVDYQCIVKSVEEVVVEEFKNTFEQYKKSLNAAKTSCPGFNLDKFNKAYGITEDCGHYFFNRILDTIDCGKNILKIKKLIEKNHNECQDTNILEGVGNAYSFEGLSGKGKMNKSEILNMLKNKLKLEYLEEQSVDVYEKHKINFSILFINRKDCIEKDTNQIVVYYEINESATTSGLFILYE